jgi:hypothetical protein
MAAAIAAIAERMADHPSTTGVRGEVLRLRQRAEALDGVNSSRSPLDTPAAHALKVAKMARTFDKEITAAINRALCAHGETKGNIERRITEKLNFKIDGDEAREVRAVIRSMKQTDRLKALDKLLEEGRGPELHAIISGSELTTGIDDGMRFAFRDSFVAKHAAAELAEQERLSEAMESFDAAQKAAARFVKELTDPDKLSQIERADAAAVAAGEAFNQSLQ